MLIQRIRRGRVFPRCWSWRGSWMVESPSYIQGVYTFQVDTRA